MRVPDLPTQHLPDLYLVTDPDVSVPSQQGARNNTGKCCLLVCHTEYPRTNRTTCNTFLDITDM